MLTSNKSTSLLRLWNINSLCKVSPKNTTTELLLWSSGKQFLIIFALARFRIENILFLLFCVLVFCVCVQARASRKRKPEEEENLFKWKCSELFDRFKLLMWPFSLSTSHVRRIPETMHRFLSLRCYKNKFDFCDSSGRLANIPGWQTHRWNRENS